ncbi:hypothetical protein ACHAWX_000886 [Stephanocyclus meneghinianus]
MNGKQYIRKSRQFMPRSLDQPWSENSISSAISYGSSSGQSEVRCQETPGPLERSLSLSYSYLVESFDYTELEWIDAVLLNSVAENVLECSEPISYGNSRASIIALKTSLDDPIMSVNYCKSGVFCNVVRRKMTLDVYGGNEDDDDSVLVTVHHAIEASMEWLSRTGQNVMYISERPTVGRAQSHDETPSNKEYSHNTFSVFAGTFIVFSGLGSIVAVIIFRFHIKASALDADDDAEKFQAPISLKISNSFDNTQPSERCKHIAPRNLEVEEFVYVAEEDTLAWMRTDFPSAHSGFRHFLDTVIEEFDLSDSCYFEDEERSV